MSNYFFDSEFTEKSIFFKIINNMPIPKPTDVMEAFALKQRIKMANKP